MGKICPAWREWEYVERLGAGSYGAVYKARRVNADAGFASWAAIKEVHVPTDDGQIDSLRMAGWDDARIAECVRAAVKRALGEIATMEELGSAAAVVSVKDYASVKDSEGLGWTIYIRMELLQSLPDWCASHHMDAREVAELGIQLAGGLASCRAHKVIHRDVKPANILRTEEGRFKLGDFGVARQLDGTSKAETFAGTTRFMAPEIINGKPYDYAVDVYALGLVLYLLLNGGMLPFERECGVGSAVAQERRRTGAELPAPVGCDSALAGIVLRACSYESAERYAAAELRDALEEWLLAQRVGAAAGAGGAKVVAGAARASAVAAKKTRVTEPVARKASVKDAPKEVHERAPLPTREELKKIALEREAPKKAAPKKAAKPKVAQRVDASGGGKGRSSRPALWSSDKSLLEKISFGYSIWGWIWMCFVMGVYVLTRYELMGLIGSTAEFSAIDLAMFLFVAGHVLRVFGDDPDVRVLGIFGAGLCFVMNLAWAALIWYDPALAVGFSVAVSGDSLDMFIVVLQWVMLFFVSVGVTIFEREENCG